MSTATRTKAMSLRGTKIRENDGDVCLNDLWTLAGEPKNTLQSALDVKITENSRSSARTDAASTYYVTKSGRGGLTFAHPVLALDYAEYLDPAIGVEVREIFIRYKERDVTLALEIMGALTDQVEYDAKRIEMRRAVAKHNVIAAGVAKEEAGVYDFEAYNGAGLRGPIRDDEGRASGA